MSALITKMSIWLLGLAIHHIWCIPRSGASPDLEHPRSGVSSRLVSYMANVHSSFINKYEHS